ncbi:MAG: response regulator [candidate division KSB1 bacterium]|nr:response regulator [candidate division KSB1 bacterium]
MIQKSILIASYDPNIYDTVSRNLQELDYDIRFAQRGVKVLNEILDGNVELLILDVELAGMMGIELLPVIKKIRPRLSVILITDDLNRRIRQIAAEEGVVYQAQKPMTPQESNSITRVAEKVIDRLYELQHIAV